MDGKGGKVGKVLVSQNNVGVALVNLPKLKASAEKKDFLIEGHRALLWQPVWLKADLDNPNEDPPVKAILEEEDLDE